MELAKQARVRNLTAFCLLSSFSLLATSTPLRFQAPAARPVVIYLDDGPFLVVPEERDGIGYLPLTPLARRLALPFTDATPAGRFTIGGPGGMLILERDTGRVTLDGEEIRLNSPALNEDGQWLVPEEFLPRALGPLLGVGFSVRPYRIIASNVPSTSLEMDAMTENGVTRLTLRLSDSSSIRVQQQPDENRVILNVDRSPVVPVREVLDYRDAAIRSVRFDDSDGLTRVVVETTPQVANVRLIPGDGNRTFLLELVSADAPPETVTAAPAPEIGLTAVADAGEAERRAIQTIVIDPGHGGLDGGTRAGGALEKELTLVLARRLGATLEARLGTTVILTREQDVSLTLAARTSIANENDADLFLSLHAGFSFDSTESQASVFVMRDPGETGTSNTAGNLFVPWYTAHRQSRDASMNVADTLAARLSARIPEWPSNLRHAPLGVLAGTTMAAVVVELGNMNNPGDVARLQNPAFQNGLIEAVVETVTASESEPETGENE